MAFTSADRVQETSTSPGGTGTLTLTGSPVPGYKSFTLGIGTGNSFYYTIYDAVTYDWEVGIGSWTANVLTRTTVLSNSLNTTAFISFVNGNTLNVWVDYPAARSVDQSDVGTAPNQLPLNQYLGKLAFQDVLDTISNNPYYDTAISDVQPTLNLDFVNSKTLDSRITFARATTATYYDAKSSAVAEQNLLLWSQAFTVSPWVTFAASVTPNTVTAPDGTLTGSTLTFTNATVFSYVRQPSLPITTGLTYTYSVYLYASSATTVSYNILNTTGTFSITTGWARYSATVTGNSATNFVQFSGTPVAGESYFAWGAQLEQRSSATAYTPTTTTAITNYIPTLQTAPINVARLDYNPVTGTPNGLLIEEQRTNLLTYSSEFSNSSLWGKFQSTITSNTIVSPDGTTNGSKLVDNTVLQRHAVYVDYKTYTVGQKSFSVYAKQGEKRRITLAKDFAVDVNSATFDLSTGTVVVNTSDSASIQAVGNGWYRCSIVFPHASGTLSCSVNLNTDTGTGATQQYTGDGWSGIYIWGAQLEAGSFPTSYIPTVASQVTRSADAASMTGTNFSSFYNISQGTLYVETAISNTGTFTGVDVISITNSAGSGLEFYKAGNSAGMNIYAGTNSVLLTSSVPVNSPVKFALSQNGLISAYGVYNGNTPLSVVPTLYTPTQLNIGKNPATNSMTGYIKKIQYYPQALSNAELQEMTL